MTSPSDHAEPRNPRARFRDRLEEFELAHPDMSAPELADLFAETLTDDDRALVVTLLAADARVLLADQFRIRFARIRSGLFAALDLQTTDQANKVKVEPERNAERRKSIYERITEWREYVPSVGHRPVLEMTRADVNEALDHRMSVLMSHYWKTEFLRRVHAGMDNDAQRVEERYSAEELAEIIAEIRKEMYRGTIRLRVKAVPALPGSRDLPRQTDGRRP